MLPRPARLHLIGHPDSPRALTAVVAWRETCPTGAVQYSPDLSVAPVANNASEVIVLLAPTVAAIESALEVADQRGLPRWAVVPASAEELALPEFASEEWEVLMLAGAMRAAIALLPLRRENARLRGDLNTVGRRLTHDLRTPLNSISTANEVLAERGAASEATTLLCQSISSAVAEVGHLIDRVGSVFRATARPARLQPLDMEEAVWNALQTLDMQARAAGAKTVVSKSWPTVTGAAPHVELMWTNLLANSLQHGGPSPRIEIGWERAGPQTRFWVRDSGPGVGPAKRAQLFHPIDRLNELNAPRGYGLSLVQRLAELQGGTTGYDPQPAPGGTFFFTLP
jgi:signal transduction histidine kinase